MNLHKLIITTFLLSLCLFTAADTGGNERISELLAVLAEDEDSALSVITELETIGGPVVNDIFESYRIGTLYFWEGEAVISDGIYEDENYVKHIKPVDLFSGEYKLGKEEMVPVKEVQTLAAGRKERKMLSSAISIVQLGLDDPDTVINAIRRIATDERRMEALPVLENLADNSPSGKIRKAAGENASIIRLQNPEGGAARLKAIRTLGRLRSLRAVPLLEEIAKEDELSSEEQEALAWSMARIGRYQGLVNVFDIIKSSISTGSILILMALGLAITFGMMGVINMAHGEIMMIGAYTTYCIQLLFGHTPETPNPIFFMFALPASFLVSALIGGFIEWSVVRKLYKRPFESLLATYGISLVLIQAVRLIFGDNRATNSPQWLQGAIDVARGMAVPTNRIFIFFTAAACVAAVWALFRYTNLGLHMRATMQNRDMAAAMGINTRKVDSYTFMLGSGIAGIAGYALTTIGGITPDMGKNYIIDSFLIVVTGGVGSLAGVTSSGMAIGFLNKILEGTLLGTVWAKILVLALVIAFIQFKPSGLFAPKGRLADD